MLRTVRTLVCAWLSCAVAGAVVASAGADTGLFIGFSEDAPKFYGEPAVSPARELGAQAMRVTLEWRPGEGPSRDDIAELDRAVGASGGMRLVLAVYASNGDLAPADDAARDDYCSFVRSTIARYPSINDVAIWNEPNLSYFWRPQFNADGSSAAPVAYEALLARCWQVLHDFRPSINVIGPTTSTHADNTRSHAPVTFLERMGAAYRANNRSTRIFDTLGIHIHPAQSDDRPWRTHPSPNFIYEGDWGRLMRTLSRSFGGTQQPIPGQCVDGACTSIWYLEGGVQTTIDAGKESAYTGDEPHLKPVPDDAGGEPEEPSPDGESPAPDQATQVRDIVRLAYCQPFVGAFFNFLLWDEADLRGYQSAPFWADRTPKDSYGVFRATFAEVNAGAVDCSRLKGPPPPTNASSPVVSGEARAGQTLALSRGDWMSSTPIAYLYQWQRCDAAVTNCSGILGATGETYTVTGADFGAVLRALVIVTSAGRAVAGLSNQTAIVSGAAGPPAGQSLLAPPTAMPRQTQGETPATSSSGTAGRPAQTPRPAGGTVVVAVGGPQAGGGSDSPVGRAATIAARGPALRLLTTMSVRPVAGSRFRLRLRVVQGESAQLVRPRAVWCRARVARVRIDGKPGTRYGLATCVWLVPAATGGRILRGTITVTLGERRVTRSFALKIARGKAPRP